MSPQQTFCSSHPDVRIVDPLDKVAKLLDRKSTMNVCSPDHGKLSLGGWGYYY